MDRALKRRDSAARDGTPDAKRLATDAHRTSSTPEQPLEDATPPPDDKLYCVCRQPYDDERIMIACDRCDNWFHAQCLGVAEGAIELIDIFICPPCEPATEQRTSYKARCHRGGCTHAARLPLSRYCSDACGMHEVLARLSRLPAGCTPARRAYFAPKVAAVDNRRGLVVWRDAALAAPTLAAKSDTEWLAAMRQGLAAARSASHSVDPPPGTSLGAYAREHATKIDTTAHELVDLRAELAQWTRQSADVHVALDLLTARAKLLQLAEDRQTLLPPLVGEDDGRKRDALPAPRCGFDARLCWDDETFFAWASSARGRAILQDEAPLDGALDDGDVDGDAPLVVCAQAKRRCKRHADWSAVRGAELEVSREALTAHLSELSEHEHAVRLAIGERI